MYRKPDRNELTILKRAFDKWGIFDFIEDKAVLINDLGHNKIREVCVLSTKLEAITCQREPYYAGLKIGELKKKFMPSMQGADLIARISKKFAHVVVNETSEKLILYGRDVLGQSIVQTSEMLRENEIVILLNTTNEPIGIGRTKVSGRDLLRHGRSTVITLIDAGYYLRSEGKSKRSYF
jgi:60S ribosome subunit biogenesis protein NIP7